VGTALDLIIAALVGLLVGAVATLAFHLSERERREEAEDDSDDLTEDEARMLAAFPDAAIILDGQGDVIRSNTRALQYHLVWADRLAHPRLAAMAEEVRAQGVSESAELELRRGPTDQSGSLHVAVSVAPPGPRPDPDPGPRPDGGAPGGRDAPRLRRQRVARAQDAGRRAVSARRDHRGECRRTGGRGALLRTDEA
jgi:hypothetical protein